MAKGGAKPGERRGGRQKGAINKISQQTRDYLDERNLSPLQVLANQLADSLEAGDKAAAVAVAKELLPYYAPKLKAQEITGSLSVHDQIADAIDLLRAGASTT